MPLAVPVLVIPERAEFDEEAEAVEGFGESGGHRVQLLTQRLHREGVSAHGFAYAVETDHDVIFHAEAKIMDLPGGKERILPLYRELRELNLVLPGSTSIGVRGNMVLATATRVTTCYGFKRRKVV